MNHTYAHAGNYTASSRSPTTRTTPDDQRGLDFGEAPPPTVLFTSTSNYLTAPFDGSGSSVTPTARSELRLGTSVTANGHGVSRALIRDGGTYQVTLTVTDNSNVTGPSRTL
jgi:hypothetical protein